MGEHLWGRTGWGLTRPRISGEAEAASKALQVEGLIGVYPGEASGSPIAWSAREHATATDSART
jgi:hypothetical protein